MTKLITTDELIKSAKDKGISLGRGNPYNRLRYFTKIGWLPHMVRQKDSSGNVVGHYPDWSLSRLEYINELKKKGFDNDDISAKISQRDKLRNITKVFGFLDETEKRTQFLTSISVFLLSIVLLIEIGIIPIGKSKTELVALTSQHNENAIIIDRGNSFISEEKKIVFVKTDKVVNSSNILVTFNNDYSPATRFWVPRIIEQEGFYLELDAPTANNAEFRWWVTN